jgi:cytochrome o ubiquinol oxidase subunit 2
VIVRSALAYRSLSRALALGSVLLCGACGLVTSPDLDPSGPIAFAGRQLLFDAASIMMIVIIPVFIMTALFAWRYRGTNRKARYAPNFSFYWPVEIVVWGVPAVIIVWLGFHLWAGTHKLDPYKAVDPGVQPLQIEAVAQDWKWLFIYPDRNIAVVNELVFPAGTPLAIRITSDTVMNSFVIPALGGQIYAMAGMQTRLHLLADKPGRFMGRNVQYSGRGFADQQFNAIATPSQEEFETWFAKVKASGDVLDAQSYARLARPSIRVPVTYYASVTPNLFDSIIAKWQHGDHANSAADGGHNGMKNSGHLR